ncbi:MAG TPA: c-type cytochrome domain-containing protein [Verrucomicrobiae bacterium]|jgi:mono/diheme cytochrome c family protein
MNSKLLSTLAITASFSWTALADLELGDASKLPPAAAKTGVTYEKDIKPILEKSCVKCHSGEKPKGKYSMESLASILKGGKEGKSVVPGNSAKSAFVHQAADLVKDMEMPPTDKRDKYPQLTKDQIALVRAWIDQGAK